MKYPELRHSMLRSEKWGFRVVVAVSAAAQRVTDAHTDEVQDYKRQQKSADNQIQQQKDNNPETTWKINNNQF